MAKVHIIAAVVALSTSYVWAGNWTETFDSGVGRLNQYNGQGDTRFTWDPVNQAIDGTYLRGPSYERYALLGDTFTAGSSVLGFSAVITPTSAAAGNSGASIGFLNSDTGDNENRFAVIFSNQNGHGLVVWDGVSERSTGVLPYELGKSYFVNGLLDGPSGVFSFDLYEGTDATGLPIGSISSPISAALASTEIDALGLSNRLKALPFGTPLEALVDDISFTIPEPSTLLLLAASFAIGLRGRYV